MPEPHPVTPTARPRGFALLRTREVLVPTWRGWLLLLAVGALLAFAAARWTHPFLAMNKPVPGGVLVVEGWVPDYVMTHAGDEFRRGGYRTLCVTGGPIEKGTPFAEHQTFAEFGAATLQRLHPELLVHAVPAPYVRQDRTFASALALRDWCRERGLDARRITVISLAVHSRRTRLLFDYAFGSSSEIGIIAIEDQSYPAARWWATSSGVRMVVGEVVGYLYARLFFRPGVS